MFSYHVIHLQQMPLKKKKKIAFPQGIYYEQYGKWWCVVHTGTEIKNKQGPSQTFQNEGAARGAHE